MRLLDSSVWVEHLTGGSRVARDTDLFDDPAEILVSTVNLFEVCRYVRRTTGVDAMEEVLAHMLRCRVADVDPQIATAAVTLAAEHGLHAADALVAATALALGAELVTLDADLARLPFASAP
jgi:predicted nucleic acid-binding protein